MWNTADRPLGEGRNLEGPIEDFRWVLPKECLVLHALVIGAGERLSLYFQAQDPVNEEEVREFVWPLHEGAQSLCTRGLPYRIVSWWYGGRVANSYSWIPHRYPPGHYVIRFVYRPQDPYQDELPPLSAFAWSIVRANMQSSLVPPSIRDPFGINRHVVRYTDDNGLGRDPTCHPRNCVYLGTLRELQWLGMLDLLTYTGL
jgi:hypothetical protein